MAQQLGRRVKRRQIDPLADVVAPVEEIPEVVPTPDQTVIPAQKIEPVAPPADVAPPIKPVELPAVQPAPVGTDVQMAAGTGDATGDVTEEDTPSFDDLVSVPITYDDVGGIGVFDTGFSTYEPPAGLGGPLLERWNAINDYIRRVIDFAIRNHGAEANAEGEGTKRHWLRYRKWYEGQQAIQREIANMLGTDETGTIGGNDPPVFPWEEEPDAGGETTEDAGGVLPGEGETETRGGPDLGMNTDQPDAIIGEDTPLDDVLGGDGTGDDGTGDDGGGDDGTGGGDGTGDGGTGDGTGDGAGDEPGDEPEDGLGTTFDDLMNTVFTIDISDSGEIPIDTELEAKVDAFLTQFLEGGGPEITSEEEAVIRRRVAEATTRALSSMSARGLGRGSEASRTILLGEIQAEFEVAQKQGELRKEWTAYGFEAVKELLARRQQATGEFFTFMGMQINAGVANQNYQAAIINADLQAVRDQNGASLEDRMMDLRERSQDFTEEQWADELAKWEADFGMRFDAQEWQQGIEEGRLDLAWFDVEETHRLNATRMVNEHLETMTGLEIQNTLGMSRLELDRWIAGEGIGIAEAAQQIEIWSTMLNYDISMAQIQAGLEAAQAQGAAAYNSALGNFALSFAMMAFGGGGG